MQKNILITGKPRSGKSTLLRKVVGTMNQKIGFVTNEVRVNGERIGFEIETSKKERAIFSDARFETPYKISRYFVNLQNLETLLPSISVFGERDLLYIDEIGQMQLLSENFKKFVLQYLNAPNTCLATISSIFEDNFTKLIKERKDVILIALSEGNLKEKELFLIQLMQKIEKAKRYIAEPDRFTKNGNTIKLKSEHGERALTHEQKGWRCDCDFFSKYNICSHTIATEEIAG